MIANSRMTKKLVSLIRSSIRQPSSEASWGIPQP